MKTIKSIFFIVLVLLITSCRDTKNETEVNAQIQEVDSLEAVIDSVSEEIETETEALENQLQELDSL